jgi:hypothetical protein
MIKIWRFFFFVNLLIKMTYYNNGRAEVPRNINSPAYNDMIVIKYRKFGDDPAISSGVIALCWCSKMAAWRPYL